MRSALRFAAITLSAALAAGCATTSSLTPDELAQQYPNVSNLSQRVTAGEQNNLAILAPDSFSTASDAAKDARVAAERGQADNANNLAAVGSKALDKAESDAKESSQVLAEVMEARKRALAAGSETLFETELTKLESQAADLGRMIEKGNAEKAKKARPELQKAYLDLELRALKEGTVQLAKAAIENARKSGADKYAPKTFRLATDEMSLAQQVLDTDRTRQDKAEAHAKRAKLLAEKSSNITELVKDFDRRDYSQEDVVLWYQENLKSATTPLNKELLFSEPNDATVGAIRTDISTLVGSLQDKDEKIANLSREVATVTALRDQETQAIRQQYEADIAGVKQQVAQRETLEAEEKARFDNVQSMFSGNEAQVYQQRKNVLISAHGFSFPPGKSEIETENFALLNKIATAITQFKGAKIYVSGHTDATGSADVNKQLSEKRADNVKQFLTEVAGIPADRIVAEGYGKERPVASNETVEGRALNRRIEVLILNDQKPQ